MNRIHLILMMVFAITGCSKSPAPPNIILISADDMGWSDLGCYGSEIRTPHIDRLAENGIRFTQFHNTSKCFPSRACLLTGVYAQQCGYDHTYTNPLVHAVTLGEVLHKAGYITLWSGKHHGLENPVTRGFDHYYGLKDGACNHFNPGIQRAGEGAPARKGKEGKKIDRAWCIDAKMYVPYTPEARDFYTTDYFTNYAINWLEEYRGDDRPLFLYMAYTAPHDPLMAWPEDIARYQGMYDQGYDAIRQKRYARQLEMGLIDSTYKLSEATHEDWNSLSAEVRREEARKMEVYAAMIDRLDQNIGRLIDKLVETGRVDNVLIMFVSDNGASAEMVSIGDDYGETGSMTRWTSLGPDWANVSNTPFRYFKNFSYEGGINTPLIAAWPCEIEPGSISRFPGHFIDIMATFVDVSGAEYPSEFRGEKVTPMQGESLLPVLMGKERRRIKPLYWEWQNGQAVREGDWKLVRDGPDREWDLYNMLQDPAETENLASIFPEKVRGLESLFLQWKADLKTDSSQQSGSLLWLRNGSLQAGILTEVGGRLVSLGSMEGNNLLKSEPLLWNEPAGERIIPTAYSGWKSYFGHIIWPGPQSDWWIHQELNSQRRNARSNWPPDPYLIFSPYQVVEQTDTSVTLEGPPSPVSGVKILKRYTLSRVGLQIGITMTNTSEGPVSWDIWSNTRFEGNTLFFVPDCEEGVLRITSSETEKTGGLEGEIVSGAFTFIAQPAGPDKETRFAKAFLHPDQGKIVAVRGGNMLVMTFDYVERDQVHPGQGFVEIYKKVSVDPEDDLLELEHHSAYVTLQPGESHELKESWIIHNYKDGSGLEDAIAWYKQTQTLK